MEKKAKELTTFALLKSTLPGPLCFVQIFVRVPPTGNPSSVKVPFNCVLISSPNVNADGVPSPPVPAGTNTSINAPFTGPGRYSRPPPSDSAAERLPVSAAAKTRLGNTNARPRAAK